MLKKKVIAHSIGNLTDARYFAGWMVDAFIFSIDPQSAYYLSPQEIGVMQSWVEGPRFYLELSDALIDQPEKYVVDLNCHGLYVPYKERGKVANLDVPIIYGIEEEELHDFVSYNASETGVLKTTKSIVEVESMIAGKGALDLYYEVVNQEVTEKGVLESSFIGLMVHGSPEEKVGFKSYDELDEIFEVLQDF